MLIRTALLSTFSLGTVRPNAVVVVCARSRRVPALLLMLWTVERVVRGLFREGGIFVHRRHSHHLRCLRIPRAPWGAGATLSVKLMFIAIAHWAAAATPSVM